MSRIIKLGLISASFFSLLFMLFTLLLPNSITISRTRDIQIAKDSLYKKISTAQALQLWLDTAIISNTSIIGDSVLQSQKLTIQLQEIKPYQVTSKWIMGNSHLICSMQLLTNPNYPNQTTLQWQFQQTLRWYNFGKKFTLLVSDDILGGMMEKNMGRL